MHNQSKGGFTLVELLVVITIVSTLIGLVGSFTVDAIQKYKLRASQLYIHSIFAFAEKKAFINEQNLKLVAQQDLLVLFDETGIKLEGYRLEDVNFISDEIRIDRFGRPSKRELKYHFNDRITTVNLLESQ